MDVRMTAQHGLRFDLCLTIPLGELRGMRLSVPGWTFLRQSYGIVRHPLDEVPEEYLKPTGSLDPRTGKPMVGHAGIKRYKLDPEEHLKSTITLPDHDGGRVAGLGMLDGEGYMTSRVVMVGNRNLGNNYGFVAWDEAKVPRGFHLRHEPILERTYTCLICPEEGNPSIEPIRFVADSDDLAPMHAVKDERLAGNLSWCTYGQQVLRHGELVDIEELLTEFYDVRHLFYFDLAKDEEQTLLRRVTARYPDEDSFRQAMFDLWRAGRPRSRYFHNAIGIGPDRLVIVQRHGTPEELGQWLREAGATDGVILDNGGSVFTWMWYAGVGHVDGRRRGGVAFSAPDWRPNSISCIAFVLKGAARHHEPPGSIGFSVT
jgi:hypothetical protein